MSYQQLTEGKRYQISILLAEGISFSQIAQKIGVHRSTISRELKRNGQSDGYLPDHAQRCAQRRKASAAKFKIAPEITVLVDTLLCWEWSPEQISAIATRIDHPVSHEWIYCYVARDKASGGQLYRHLRQGHRRYRKGVHSKRSPILEACSIDERPEVANSRERLGDWEADTVIGQQGTGVLVTLAERKSRLYLVKRVDNKRADTVRDAIIEMLTPYIEHVHTITFDNGGEFADHKIIAAALNAQAYFAHPYSSWERGLNENFNGLLRQYISKGKDLRLVSDEEVQQAQMKLNLRPRKCLEFRQPLVVFEELRQAV